MSDKKSKSRKCPGIAEIPGVPECENNFIGNNYTFDFENHKCYNNNVYHGDIIEQSDTLIKVKVNNCNRYMNGSIIDFKVRVKKL